MREGGETQNRRGWSSHLFSGKKKNDCSALCTRYEAYYMQATFEVDDGGGGLEGKCWCGAMDSSIFSLYSAWCNRGALLTQAGLPGALYKALFYDL